jgi:hypothetical protein
MESARSVMATFAPTAPSVNSIFPTSAIHGTTVNTFSVNGSHFDSGATISFSGDSSDVGITYISRTTSQIITSLTIAATAVPGVRDVTVTNSDGQNAVLQSAFTILPSFTEAVTQGVASPQVASGQISTTFKPNFNLTLAQAAQLGGYDHFNWVQIITYHGGLTLCQSTDPIWPAYFPSPDCYVARSLLTQSSNFPIVPFFDVPAGGFQYQVDACTAASGISCTFPVEDNLPWYWDEKYTAETYQVAQGHLLPQARQAACDGESNCQLLSFVDIPSCYGVLFSPCTIQFATILVGVRPNGTGDALNISACDTATSLSCVNNVGTGFVWHAFGGSITVNWRLQNLIPDPATTVVFDGFKAPGPAGFSAAELQVFSQSGIEIRDASGGFTMPVIIDIKPGSLPNAINPNSAGKIPVAILSTANFDAPASIDDTSLKFGRTGNEDSLAFCHADDVNGDGLPDLVCQFYASKTDFQAGDIEGIIQGKTHKGDRIYGKDSVFIVPAHGASGM